MQHPGFFERAGPFSLAELAEFAGATVPASADGTAAIEDAKPLDAAGPAHVTFLDNREYVAQLRKTNAAACFVIAELAPQVPAGTVALVTREPYRAFALTLARYYPSAGRPRTAEMGDETGPVHSTAMLEEGVILEPGAVVGREARIGRGTVIAAGALVGYRVTIGRDCFIGPSAALTHTLAGDRVIVHAGVKAGQDGFGFAMGAKGHSKVPQIGRVVIQDDVEIGANSTIDRGSLKDTIIGEGTKIDNLVQIGHNVVIGRHCIIVGMVGISGSAELGDFVVVGGQAGIVGHVKIGSGAQIAGGSGVTHDLAPGGRYGGAPAKPLAAFAREIAALKQLAQRKKD
jgi:UDP-3-O-[3-hydroxymyristoyl] glucosamine N-acyltransferase